MATYEPEIKYQSDSKSESGVVKDEEPTEVSTPPQVNGIDGKLHRELSARQVQMIAIAGTIGTGLFLGTGSSLAQGGPASILICYTIVGFIVYVTLLLLGELGTQYPVTGSFGHYCTRFFSPSYGFALTWNYWGGRAISLAGDLVSAQLIMSYWTEWNPWAVALLFWVFLVMINAIHVKAYGELEYWLSSLKIVAIVIFIIVGVIVNVGVNHEHRYIGGENWRLPGAPFVGGFGGFLSVFVTASFAYGSTESLGITAGETKNPSRNMPRVVKFVFWRVLIFYVLSILLIGLNVPYNYPNLSTRSAITSPFAIVFEEVGAVGAASFMNTVVLTSVVSAANHNIYAGTRVIYGLAVVKQAPRIFTRTTKNGIPIPALVLTSSVSMLCFGSSYIGNGLVWEWLKNLTGVSVQIAWLSIGITSWRFRKAWVRQGRPLEEMKFRAKWTWPWAPAFVVISVIVLILVQGWHSIYPNFVVVDFVSFYIELPIMAIMTLAWLFIKRRRNPDSLQTSRTKTFWYTDMPDLDTMDLHEDEYKEVEDDIIEDEKRAQRTKYGNFVFRVLWRSYYWVA
ncbi:hypothetical protein AGABI1DRAFT_74756 [Agaricus bisporus var. burnettii JB137-S8]|uniref:Amino acid permease/ SLC12A domain-containing protein n=1 Tax=Agaricus bisporus var. burnettii (strain JB137-S8 / ATCC MYA-4627 / FGSC 10392) TaxID=597362 RepID=K5X8X2_AGABU|nr:uncharacterized protein AGABI1DRAFT_74756 [Agaricus bisporus var. burnettii JB137-S8]EKM79648.1 hypothetical protein AGABI1DRAFT_74756 [Agaricus bisporus var. burnettii JB137-S8]